MLDDIFGDSKEYVAPTFKPKSKFKFSKGQEIKFQDRGMYVYEIAGDYVTIRVIKKLITASLMAFMDEVYDAVYNGPVLEWSDGAHVTFKRKS